MRVLLLCHKDFVPDKKVKSVAVADNSLWRTEYYVREALKRLGYKVKICAIENTLTPLKNDIKKFKPKVVFNLVEEFCGEGLLEPFVVSYLEAVKQPFTGCGSLGLIMAQNKIAAKVVLNSAKVLTPGNKKYPKIVKLLNEESSRGITDSSVVHSVEEEKIQIDKLKNEYDSTIFTEEYIRGREIHVAVLMRRGQYYAAPLWETTFGRKKGARIISEKVKWNFAYRIRVGVELVPALNIGKSLVKKIQNTAIKACRALEVTGHARVDIRLTQDNKIYVLEVNPNPEISYGDEFAECIRSGGTEYDDMIKGIVMEALR